jgi:FkbM family methyltransferase
MLNRRSFGARRLLAVAFPARKNHATIFVLPFILTWPCALRHAPQKFMLSRICTGIVRLWSWACGRPAGRRLNNFLIILGTSGLGIGDADARRNGEQRILRRWLERCGPDPVVWDVGANEGGYTALVRAARPDARIYAFEPQPRTFARLAARWAGEPGIRCLPCALGSEPGHLALWDYESNAEGSSHATFHPAAVRRETGAGLRAQDVPVRTIDEVAGAERVEAIALLKLDVEGHELACLKGAAGLLAQGKIAAIQFEFNFMHLDARVNMGDFAAQLPGFTLCRILPHGLLPLNLRNTMLSNLYHMQNILAVRDPEALA